MSDEDFGSWIRKQVMRDLFFTDFIQELIHDGELKDSMKSYNDFYNFYKDRKENTSQLESLNEALNQFLIYKEKNGFLAEKDFVEIYENALKARFSILSLIRKVNDSISIKNPDDINLYETLDSISSELNSLIVLFEDISFDHIEKFDEHALDGMRSKIFYPLLPRERIEFELMEIARDEFRKEKLRNKKKESRKA
ncbi:hypothetical protein [Leptospira limi]|uniref:Uncharacterized protein n=1 Tax=Leptospira limi TaxID=2950023 RepID=A0ABT3LYI4_9LEPT|nr:hypothetical protein [Leptospira limi]MCW7462792.1 hypothetical protein [Leptospira limi]